MLLAVEMGGISTQGHEVTSPPRNDDQSETLRIVTEAVELGEVGPVEWAVPIRRRAGQDRSRPTGLLVLRAQNDPHEKREDPTGEVP